MMHKFNRDMLILKNISCSIAWQPLHNGNQSWPNQYFGVIPISIWFTLISSKSQSSCLYFKISCVMFYQPIDSWGSVAERPVLLTCCSAAASLFFSSSASISFLIHFFSFSPFPSVLSLSSLCVRTESSNRLPFLFYSDSRFSQPPPEICELWAPQLGRSVKKLNHLD